MTRTTTTTTADTVSAQPSVSELWAAYDRQHKEVKALYEQLSAVYEAYDAAAACREKLFDVAYEAEFGRKFKFNGSDSEPVRLVV